MRQIVLNELNSGNMDVLREYLAENASPGALEGMFWVSIPEAYLAEAQQGHEACGPFVFAIELGKDSATFELLVRSSSNLHCSCTCYATPEQRGYLLDFFDAMVSAAQITI